MTLVVAMHFFLPSHTPLFFLVGLSQEAAARSRTSTINMLSRHAFNSIVQHVLCQSATYLLVLVLWFLSDCDAKLDCKN